MSEELLEKNNNYINTITKPVENKININAGIDTTNEIIDNILAGGLNSASIANITSTANMTRGQKYQVIDTMCQDSQVSSVLNTFVSETCVPNDAGDIVWCESDNPQISKFVNYLLKNLQINKNIFSWVYCLLKYGDFYLKLYRESDLPQYSNKEKLNESVLVDVNNPNDKLVYYVEQVTDPSTIFELNAYGQTYGFIETPFNNLYTTQTLFDNFYTQNYKLKQDTTIYSADSFVHGYLQNYNRRPEQIELFNEDDNKKSTIFNIISGTSILLPAYKVWREKSLLENSILLSRITKSSIARVISVDVPDMPKEQVKATLARIKSLFEQKTAINTDSGMSEYTDPGPIENNIYTATHNGQGAISVQSIGGDADVKGLADLDNWVNKFYAAFGIPKHYFGYTDDGAGFNGGTSLSILSSVFAKQVENTKRAIISTLTTLVNIYLLDKGCPAYVNNFTLKMIKTATQEDKDLLEAKSNQINEISSAMSLFDIVENKENKLKILKTLTKSLNWDSNIIEAIDNEIELSKNQSKEEKEE